LAKKKKKKKQRRTNLRSPTALDFAHSAMALSIGTAALRNVGRI